MAKKKKDKKSEEHLKRVEKSKEILTNLKEQDPKKDYVITVPDDAIIDIKISGYFRKKFEQVFYYLLAPLSADEIVATMAKIKKGFANVPQDQLTLTDDVVDTMMTLISEINYQAGVQNKTTATDKYVNEAMADFINDSSFQNAVNVQETAEKVKEGWKESDPIHYNRVVNSEFNKPEESNEDSSQ
mgnify:CR=1 FL=1